MAARIPATLILGSTVLALAGASKPARAQSLPRLDTARAHVFGGQPFRLDALTPWRRSGGTFSLTRSASPAGDATTAERPFRLRSQRTPPPPTVSRTDESGGFLAALADALVPVLGITRDQLRDSFGNARKGHRHNGIDIMAPRGTPVVAAVDGSVLKLKWDRGGGRTVRLLDSSGRFIFYYAHLSGYARGLQEGEAVRKGQVLGYVGRTGTVKGSSHLHLGIASLLGDSEHWWKIRPLNPYTLLRHALGLQCDSAVAEGAPCPESADSSR
jgi:murein DD-endopeptidase MepM/ murein hydrolase activator NlpD